MSRKIEKGKKLSLADRVYLADRGQLPAGEKDPRRPTAKGRIIVGLDNEEEPTSEPTSQTASEPSTEPTSEPTSEESTQVDYTSMSKKDLQAEAKSRDLSTSGTVADLVERLMADDETADDIVEE